MQLDMFLANSSMHKVQPLGIPYMGSKRKHATDLINQILLHKPDAKYFYDLFGGGGAMSFAAMQKGLQVFYNEKQTDMVNFMRFIFDCIKKPQSEYGLFPAEYYQFITRKKFLELRAQSGNYAQFARIVYSFGNKQTCYLFSPELEKYKRLGHDLVVFRCKKALAAFNKLEGVNLTIGDAPDWNQRRLDFKSYIYNYHKKSKVGEIKSQLTQLDRLHQLERLGRLHQNISFTNLDYREVKITTPPHETIVYLDPPYRGTAKYIEGINHNELDAYFAALPFTAFMSEYNAPFNCVYKKAVKSNLAAKKPLPSVEKLYINHGVLCQTDN